MMLTKEIEVKDGQRVFVCGDLHGEYLFFMKCLQELDFKVGTDILVCTGDLVDRGPNSYELLCHFLYNKTSSFHSVRGNHDEFLVQKDYSTALYNGARWILDYEKETLEILGKRISETLPYAITISTPFSRYGVCHAEVPIEFENWDYFLENIGRCKEEVVWSRDVIQLNENLFYKNKLVTGVECVFHGHTIVEKEPFIVNNRWYIDTGASYYGNLTFVELTESGNIVRTFNKHALM